MAASAQEDFLTLKDAREKFEEAADFSPNDYHFYDYNDSNTWGFYKHPFCDFLHSAGYHSVMLIHPQARQTQFGSYEVQKQDQKHCNPETYYVFAQDEGGYVITDKNDPNTGVVDEFAVVNEFLEKLSSDATARELRKLYFDGTKWTVVKRFARTSEVGPMVFCKAKKVNKIDLPGWSSRAAGEHMCWQQYSSDGTPQGEATWDPQIDLKVGDELVMTRDENFFYNAMGPHTAYYDDATWDQHKRQTLGQKCKVLEVLENFNIAKVEINLEDAGKVEWHVPGECLFKEEAGETILLMAELGQYVLSAQVDLYDTATHNARSRNVNPIVTEISSLIQYMYEVEDTGMLDCTRDAGFDNLKYEIQTWQTNNADWEWGS